MAIWLLVTTGDNELRTLPQGSPSAWAGCAALLHMTRKNKNDEEYNLLRQRKPPGLAGLGFLRSLCAVCGRQRPHPGARSSPTSQPPASRDATVYHEKLLVTLCTFVDERNVSLRMAHVPDLLLGRLLCSLLGFTPDGPSKGWSV